MKTESSRKKPFWRTKPLDQMTPDEWEALCDRCGLCCRLKEVDTDTGRIRHSQVACRMLDLETCLCHDYEKRVPECIKLTPQNVPKLRWLPPSCAYRLLAHGGDLPPWHPLITGDPESPHRAGFSIRDRVISENELPGNF